ncbi:MAG: bifunctional UDP-N-acetylglucosamine diphosphorylase/glucosamine-1-phosphate N-acetyltransferase GlmU [Armatimonadia bacterium]
MLAALVLAAGEGKRMKSALAKPLHKVCGKTMIDHVLDYLRPLGTERIAVVLGVGREMMEQALASAHVDTAIQHEQLGTGHAVMSAAELFADYDGDLLITCADIPLVRPDTLRALLEEHHTRGAAGTVLTALYDDPTGYGRLVRDDNGLVQGIVEHKDATPEIRAIREINAGIYVFNARKLFAALKLLRPDNAQGEYYLTDVIARFVEQGDPVAALPAPDPAEVMGINNRIQLSQAETVARNRTREAAMLGGATLIDPTSTYLDAGVTIGPDTIIWPGAMILGNTTIGANCTIGPNTRLEDAVIGEGCEIRHASTISNSTLHSRVTVGPFAYIRPDCEVGDDSRVGAHTELVRTTLGRGVKDSHFSYLGDCEVGDGTNIGAGTITCNYDGETKHRTTIGENAFIGSDAVLVAPVTIAAGAYIAAGSSITKDVPEAALGIGRARQEVIENWAKRRRKHT